MRIYIFVYLFISSFLIFSSCSYKQNQILFEKRDALTDSSLQKNAVISNYRIHPQDILQVRNLQNMQYIVGNMSAEGGSSSAAGGSSSPDYQVEEDGNVALPVIGRVQVSGLTRIEAAKKIEGLYSEKLLKDPIIDVKIVNLKVTVLGEIKGQGNYPLVKDRTTLIELIGEAGGFTEKANEKNIKIIRGNPNNPQVIHVDLSDINAVGDPQTLLQNGDIIYIAQNKRAIRADNLQDFSIIVQPVLIIINTALIIFTLAHR